MPKISTSTVGISSGCFAYLKKIISFIRFKEFDTSIPDGRLRERYRRASLTVLTSGLAKGVSIVTMLITVPLTLSYLGAERYGMWMTISSFVLLLGFADLGMGLGLMNIISQAYGRDDQEAASLYVSSAFFMFVGISMVILISFFLIYPHVSWEKIFNVKSMLAIQEAGPAVMAFLLCFVANLSIGVVQPVQMGYQEGYMNNLWEILGRVLGLVGLLLVIHFKAGLVWLVVAITGAPVITSLLNGLLLFGHSRPWLRPRWRFVSREAAVRTFKMGILFFVLQFALVLTYQSHNIILAQMMGPEAVTQYAVPARVFIIVQVFLSFVYGPLWPAYTEAIERGEIPWVKKTFQRSIILGLLFSIPVIIFLIIFGPQIIVLWVGKKVEPSFLLLLGLGGWALFSAIYSPFSILFNSLNIFKFQIICFLLMTTIGVPLSIIFVHLIGIPGVIFGSSITLLLFVLLPSVFYAKRLFYEL